MARFWPVFVEKELPFIKLFTPETMSVHIKEETIPQLNAGASADVAGFIRVDRDYDPGTITFSAAADPSNSVTETLDTNNDAELTSALVDNQPPNAVIAVDKDSALRGEYFTFNCLDTTDPESPLLHVQVEVRQFRRMGAGYGSIQLFHNPGPAPRHPHRYRFRWRN